MREILELCVDLDRTVHECYRDMSDATSRETLSATFGELSREEAQRVGWWSDLLGAWEDGLVPDIADEHSLLARLREVRVNLEDALPEHVAGLSDDDLLDLAVRLEFHRLDPAFSELAGLMEPVGNIEHSEARFRHVTRLIGTVREHHSQERLAGFLAAVLLRAYRDQQRLAVLSVRDQLTGLYDRRGLLSHLRQWLAWSKRYDRPLSVVLIDIDEFKSVNDTRGHAAGDETLKAVADALRRGVRSSDLIGRYGGDEFMVLAPETDSADLELLMDRLVTSARSTADPERAGFHSVTVSAGGAWTLGAGSVTPESLVAAADASLYEAKSAGRDRAGTPRQSAAL